MPHYQSGREAKLFDKVKFVNGSKSDGKGGWAPTYAEGIVFKIQPGADCCELTIVSGSLDVLGTTTVSHPLKHIKTPDGTPVEAWVSFQAVLIDGTYTSRTAKDCEFVT
jgi:hypothetical protein